MASIPSAFVASLRRARPGAIAGGAAALLAHCAWVLLNGSSVLYRLWTVLVGAFLPFLWTFLFKQAKHIPVEIRPPIHIDLLPRLNALLLSPFGIVLLTLSLLPLARLVYFWGHGDKPQPDRGRGRAYAISILLFPIALWFTDYFGKAQPTNFLDLLAFGSYGALHFASPIIAGWWIWGFGCQGAACTFGFTLGTQNLAGLATHLVFPNAAPWFYDVYGIDAAQPDYSYPGNPAGLIRVDTILGTHIYAKAFKWGAVVFGAIPSLHAATSICCGLYATRYSKGYRGLAFMWVYCFWMFWATQYLHHHFAIDLLCGTFYSLVAFTLFERVRLRKLDLRHYSEGLTTGWDRLRWSLHDGDNFTEYGARQVARLTGKDAWASDVSSRSTSGSSSRRGSSALGGGGGTGTAGIGGPGARGGGGGGYAAVPTDRPSWDLHDDDDDEAQDRFVLEPKSAAP
ncbi:hypothetical protein JCM10212_004215 [Sporobolomyces blumeae]